VWEIVGAEDSEVGDGSDRRVPPVGAKGRKEKKRKRRSGCERTGSTGPVFPGLAQLGCPFFSLNVFFPISGFGQTF
jgi:hypothetical protein